MRQRVYLIYHKRRYVLVRCPKRTVCNADYSITASEKCHQEKRKTVNGEDILFAMTSLGFENYAEALKIYLSKYREVSFFLLKLVFLLYNYQNMANRSLDPISTRREPARKSRRFRRSRCRRNRRGTKCDLIDNLSRRSRRSQQHTSRGRARRWRVWRSVRWPSTQRSDWWGILLNNKQCSLYNMWAYWS